MMEAFGRKSMVSPTVAIIPSFFAKSSTAYNPLIYVFMSRKVCCSKVLSVVDFENITRITLMPGNGETLARLNKARKLVMKVMPHRTNKPEVEADGCKL